MDLILPLFSDDVSPVKGSRGILITPDKSLSDYDADCEGTELYDLLALPGSLPIFDISKSFFL